LNRFKASRCISRKASLAKTKCRPGGCNLSTNSSGKTPDGSRTSARIEDLLGPVLKSSCATLESGEHPLDRTLSRDKLGSLATKPSNALSRGCTSFRKAKRSATAKLLQGASRLTFRRYSLWLGLRACVQSCRSFCK
jgi:hypothetical protein